MIAWFYCKRMFNGKDQMWKCSFEEASLIVLPRLNTLMRLLFCQKQKKKSFLWHRWSDNSIIWSFITSTFCTWKLFSYIESIALCLLNLTNHIHDCQVKFQQSPRSENRERRGCRSYDYFSCTLVLTFWIPLHFSNLFFDAVYTRRD